MYQVLVGGCYLCGGRGYRIGKMSLEYSTVTEIVFFLSLKGGDMTAIIGKPVFWLTE